jgi:hypothetical protein
MSSSSQAPSPTVRRPTAAALLLALAACSPSGHDPGPAAERAPAVDGHLASQQSPDAQDRTGGWRLAAEDSPYLRQHADNPVEWHPWGEAAFELARQRDVPVFLSIGYSSCHWCHVMEHESFEDQATADWLNEHFVNIKVDREQRPDVDDRYMAAVIAMTGQGGWPMSVWLTPDGEPFMGGTYFPPADGRGRPGFLTICEQVRTAWVDDRPRLLEAVAHNAPILVADRLPPAGAWDGPALLDTATAALISQMDPVLGGMSGNRPQRFPPSTVITFLLRRAARGEDVDLAPVHVTLDAMATHGMRDHVAGGFHRYSVDPRWQVPHFEKMLYDNALLTEAYALAHAVTGEARHGRVASDTLRWLREDMRSPEGLAYAARDADSLPFDDDGVPLLGAHPEEGDVTTWTPAEVIEVLGPDDGAAFNRLFSIVEGGNFERGRSIPRPGRTDEQLAADPGEGVPSAEDFSPWLERVRRTLLEARAARPQAFRDEKCLSAWNGLLLSGLSAATRYVDPGLAAETRDFGRAVLEHLTWRDDDGGLRVWHQRFEERSSGDGDLADHAHLARGLLDAHGATGDPAFLAAAWELAVAMIGRFEDTQNGGFFLTEGNDPLLPTRGRELEDGAIPSSQSVALTVLARLAPLDDGARLTPALDRGLERLASMVGRSPRGFPALAITLDAVTGPLAEVVLSGAPGDEDYEALVAAARSQFLPAELLIPHAPSAAQALAAVGLSEVPALLKDRDTTDATAWVCRNGTCLAPARTPEDLQTQWPLVTAP